MELGHLSGLRVINLGNFQRTVKSFADFDTKPELNRVGQKIDGKQKKQNVRNQRQADKRGNQFCAQFGAENSLATLGKQFENIADDQEKQ